MALGLRCSSSHRGLILLLPHSRWARLGEHRAAPLRWLGQEGQDQPSPKLTLHLAGHNYVSFRLLFPPQNYMAPPGDPSLLPPPPHADVGPRGCGSQTWTRSGVRRLARSHFWKRCVRRRARSRLQVFVFSREVQMRLSALSCWYLEVSRVMSTSRQLFASSV